MDNAQDLLVVFRVIFNEDGTVKRGPDVIGGRPGATGPIFAESARRAILQCQPYTMLRRETYDELERYRARLSIRAICSATNGNRHVQ